MKGGAAGESAVGMHKGAGASMPAAGGGGAAGRRRVSGVLGSRDRCPWAGI